MKKPDNETQEEYRQRIMDVICGCLAQGKPLVQILTADGMPCYATIMNWIATDDALLNNYMRAREASADYLADEIVHISDTELDPQVARVRIDARKWVAAKMKPKKYGEKITHSGDADNPLEVKHKHELTEDALIAIIQA